MDRPKIPFKKFKKNWEGIVLPMTPSNIRRGQALMDYLANVWYDEYVRISAIDYYDETDIDCFFNSKLIPNTLAHLEKVWK